MTAYCPTCRRRHYSRRRDVPAAQLAFNLVLPGAAPPRPTPSPIRLLVLYGCPDAEGQPRAALLPHGARNPTAFPSIAAALAAKRAMEAAR